MIDWLADGMESIIDHFKRSSRSISRPTELSKHYFVLFLTLFSIFLIWPRQKQVPVPLTTNKPSPSPPVKKSTAKKSSNQNNNVKINQPKKTSKKTLAKKTAGTNSLNVAEINAQRLKPSSVKRTSASMDIGLSDSSSIPNDVDESLPLRTSNGKRSLSVAQNKLAKKSASKTNQNTLNSVSSSSMDIDQVSKTRNPTNKKNTNQFEMKDQFDALEPPKKRIQTKANLASTPKAQSRSKPKKTSSKAPKLTNGSQSTKNQSKTPLNSNPKKSSSSAPKRRTKSSQAKKTSSSTSNQLSSSSTTSLISGLSTISSSPHSRKLSRSQTSSQASQITTPSDDQWTNVLQIPMLPLSENLTDELYGSFETCPVKYAAYRTAIEEAVLFVSKELKISRIILYVVGAGRGAFVHSCVETQKSLKSHPETSHILMKIFAIDKNPVSIKAMNERSLKEGWNQNGDSSLVTILDTDMRLINPPEKSHIIISELLGSFSDNELSPECLIGIEERIAIDPKTVVMIPQRYTSFIVPARVPLNVISQVGDEKQTPYVVKLKDEELVGSPQPCSTFNHPNVIIKPEHKMIDFTSKTRCSINCLIGYFECQLFGNVGFSTNPAPTPNCFPTSIGMTSWYPMLFPLECSGSDVSTLTARPGDKITVDIYRKYDNHKAWYEWKALKAIIYGPPITDPIQKETYEQLKSKTVIHNEGGFEYNMPFHELPSS